MAPVEHEMNAICVEAVVIYESLCRCLEHARSRIVERPCLEPVIKGIGVEGRSLCA
jgi:hypothetical protein